MDQSRNTTSTAVSRGTLVLLAAACGITVGNVYLCQPLLSQIAVSLGVSESLAGLVAVGAQAGYTLGILFVLPLADVLASRKLIRILTGLTALFTLVAAFSPTIPVLVAASIALTTTTVIPQILIPVISGLAPVEQRGRIIGTMQTGLILGILLSRTVAGGLAQLTDSWRSPYLLASVLTGVLFIIVPARLPENNLKKEHTGYLSLLLSLPSLLKHRELRLSMMLGFLVFGAFSAFWATLAFHLAGPGLSMGPATAGLFGLLGAPGALLAPLAGRLSDRVGTFRISLFSLFAVSSAFILAGWAGALSLIILILAVNLLDFGLQSGQIANQTRIFALGSDIRARVNTLYMVATFGGGALGSWAGMQAWLAGNWQGVCLLGLILVTLAAFVLVMSSGRTAIRQDD